MDSFLYEININWSKNALRFFSHYFSSFSSLFDYILALFAIHLCRWFIHTMKHILVCISADTGDEPISFIQKKKVLMRMAAWLLLIRLEFYEFAESKENCADDRCETNGTSSDQMMRNAKAHKEYILIWPKWWNKLISELSLVG